MVTHQMSVLTSACEEVAILENGKLDTQGPVRQVFAQQSHALKNLLGNSRGENSSWPGTVTLSIPSRDDFLPDMADDLGIEVTLMGSPHEICPKEHPVRQIRVQAHDVKQVTAYLDCNKLQWQVIPIAASMN